MTTLEESTPAHRGWRTLDLVCLGAVMLLAGCSQGSAPTTPTALGPGSGAAGVHGDGLSSQSHSVASTLSAVRAATARYHDLSEALAAGYQLGYRGVVTGCVANPGVGAMGYHYFNWAKMDDPAIDEDDPEVLVYHTQGGTLVLGAVEWVVPRTLWEGAGNTEPPAVFGQTLHVLNPVLNWYVEHAWIWKPNPAGMFADWNPDVTCP
jgi:hypothetical protein